MSFDVFANGHCRSDEEMGIRLHNYPLLVYAARHWGDHAREGSEEAIKELALKFLGNDLKLMCSSQANYNHGISECWPMKSSLDFSKGVTRLHIASSFGLQEIVRLLLEKGADVGARDDRGGTALHEAVSDEHEAVMRVLLEKGPISRQRRFME